MSEFNLRQQKIKNILDELHSSFGGREYSPSQFRIISELVDRYGMQNFGKVAQRLLENGTRKPYPVDFKNALQNLPSTLKPKSEERGYEIQCQHCMDSGKVFLDPKFVTHVGNPVLMLCNCLIGKQSSENSEGLPRIDESMKTLTFPWKEALNYAARRSDLFKTKLYQDPKANFDNRLNIYDILKRQSQNYWAQQKQKNQNKNGGKNA